jgi:type II restriction enzyme
MPLNLANFDLKARDAIKAFWGNRQEAAQKQIEAGKIDAGERSGVTAGKNLDGFIALIIDLVEANGLSRDDVHRGRALVTLPGYFRSTKVWDLIVVREGRLIAAIELKSHVGPSFSNNFNNRTEEAIGTAHDLNTALREGAFGAHPRPFVGWLMVVEDAPKSRSPVRSVSKHFPVFSLFEGTSYLQRYDILCQRLVQEQLYTAASVIASTRGAASTGVYVELSELSGLRAFVRLLAARVAAEASR